jgi:hypothetical protein
MRIIGSTWSASPMAIRKYRVSAAIYSDPVPDPIPVSADGLSLSFRQLHSAVNCSPFPGTLRYGESCCSARVQTPNRVETAWGRQNISIVGLQDLTPFLPHTRPDPVLPHIPQRNKVNRRLDLGRFDPTGMQARSALPRVPTSFHSFCAICVICGQLSIAKLLRDHESSNPSIHNPNTDAAEILTQDVGAVAGRVH